MAGVAWMAFAMSCIGIVDALAKWLGVTLHGLQVTWGYFAAAFVTLLVVAVTRQRSPLALAKTPRWRMQCARAACLVGSLSCLFVALQHMPLAEATTISFTAPLFTVALAGPMLGERVGWQRWMAVIVGMAGAILVVRPGGELFQPAALLPFVGAGFFAMFNIVTGMLGGERPETTLLYTFGAGTVMASAWLPFVWQTPNLYEGGLFVVAGAIGLLAHFGIVRAFAEAEVSVVAPLNYVRLIWAISLGVLWFDQWPDTLALVGGLVIVGSGLYVVMRAARGH
jgi:drug/metabolite transporter (DMT)-like permease